MAANALTDGGAVVYHAITCTIGTSVAWHRRLRGLIARLDCAEGPQRGSAGSCNYQRGQQPAGYGDDKLPRHRSTILARWKFEELTAKRTRAGIRRDRWCVMATPPCFSTACAAAAFELNAAARHRGNRFGVFTTATHST